MRDSDTPLRHQTGGARPAIPVSEAARILGVSPTAVKAWVADGILDGYAVQRADRKRHFVYVSSVQQLQVDRSAHPDVASPAASGDDRALAAERDEWRAQATRLRVEVAALNAALDAALATSDAKDGVERSLRDVVAALRTVNAQSSTLDRELFR
jgi:hypothetical protein